jgi:hypothetical protein
VRLGWVLYLLGELVLARTHLEQAALYKVETHPHITLGMTNPRLDCLIIGSWTLWTLGYPEQALKWSRESVGRATEMSYPFSLASALSMAAIFHLFRRDGRLARERAEAAIELATEQGFPA